MSVTTSIKVDPSGKTLAFVFTDASTGLPVAVTALGSVPTVNVNGSPTTLNAVSGQTNSPIWGANASGQLPYLLYAFPSAVAAGQSVTVTASSGWCTLTSGSAPALANVAADVSAVGVAGASLLGPVALSAKSMPVGYNFDQDISSEPLAYNADLARRAAPKWTGSGGTPTVDSLFNLTAMNAATSATSSVTPIMANPLNDGKGYPSAPTGTYTLKWHGPWNGLTLKLPSTTGTGIVSGIPTGSPALATAATNPGDSAYSIGGVSQVGAHIAGGDAGGAYLLSAANPSLHPTSGGAASWWGWARVGDATNTYLLFDKSGRYTAAGGTAGQREWSMKVVAAAPQFAISTDGSAEQSATWGSTLNVGDWFFWYAEWDAAGGLNLYVVREPAGWASTTPVNKAAATAFSTGTSRVAIAGNHNVTGVNFDVDAIGCASRKLTSLERSWLTATGFARAASELGQGGTDGVNLTAGGGVLAYYDLQEAAGNARASSVGSGPSLAETGTGTVATVTGAEQTPLSDNTAVYSLPVANSVSAYAPQIQLYTTKANNTNIRLYGPGCATDGSQEWLPQTLWHLGPAPKVLRYSQPTQVAAGGNANYATWADYQGNGGGGLGDQSGTRSSTVSFTAVGPPTGANAAFKWYTNYIPVQFSAVAHGLVDGQTVVFTPAVAAISTTGGGTGVTSLTIANLTQALVRCDPGDPDHFVCGFFFTNGDGTEAVNGTQAISGTCTSTFGQGTPIPRCMDMADLAGHADHWVCTHHITADAEVTAKYAYIGNRIKGTSQKVYCELSNEHWNVAAGFTQNLWFYGKGVEAGFATGVAADYFYADRAAHLHGLAHAALEAVQAGLGARLVRVYGSWATVPSTTTNLLTRCQSQGYPVDVVGIAPYWGAGPLESSLGSTYDLFDEDGLATALALWAAYGTTYAGAQVSLAPRTVVSSHYALFTGAGDLFSGAFAAVKVACYEGGFNYGGFTSATRGTGTGAGTLPDLSLRMSRHPRLYGLMLRVLQWHQDEGCILFNHYSLSALPGRTGNVNSAGCWGAYVGVAQQPGLGDGSDGQFNNAGGTAFANLENLGSCVSVIGQALNTWQCLSNPSAANFTLAAPASVRPTVAATLNLSGTTTGSGARTLTLYTATAGSFTSQAVTASAGSFATTATLTPAATPYGQGVVYALSDDGLMRGVSSVFSVGNTNAAANFLRRLRA